MSTRMIARRIGTSPTPPEHLEAMAAAAWHQRGVLLVDLAEVRDDWLRARLESFGAERYGRRRLDKIGPGRANGAPEEKRRG